MQKDNLSIAASLSLAHADTFVIHADTAYIFGKYGRPDDNRLNIVDIRNSEKPELVMSVPFENTIDCAGVRNGILYVMESYTGFHMFDVTDPRTPVKKSFVLLPAPCEGFSFLGDRMVGIFDKRLSIIDIDDDNAASTLIKLDDSIYCMSLIVFGENIFFTNNETLLQRAVYDGKTLSTAECYRYHGMIGKRILDAGESIYISGENRFWVMDKNKPGTVVSRAKTIHDSIKHVEYVMPLRDGNAIIVHTGFSGSPSFYHFESASNKLEELFQLYRIRETKEYVELVIGEQRIGSTRYKGIHIPDELMGKISHIDHLRGLQYRKGHLYATYGDEFIIWKINEQSILGGMCDIEN